MNVITIQAEPSLSIPAVIDSVLRKYTSLYQDNTTLWEEVMTSLGSYLALGKKLYRAKQKKEGRDNIQRKKIKLENDVTSDSLVVVLENWRKESEVVENDFITGEEWDQMTDDAVVDNVEKDDTHGGNDQLQRESLKSDQDNVLDDVEKNSQYFRVSYSLAEYVEKADEHGGNVQLQKESLNAGKDNVVDDVKKTANISEFLTDIGLAEFIELFEYEMIDLEILREMSHEDLSSVGVKRFGQRFKILKGIKLLN